MRNVGDIMRSYEERKRNPEDRWRLKASDAGDNFIQMVKDADTLLKWKRAGRLKNIQIGFVGYSWLFENSENFASFFSRLELSDRDKAFEAFNLF